MTTRALLLCAALAALGSGQPAPADSLRRQAPVPTPKSDSTRAVPRRSPGLALALSLVIPGGGQVYTGNYWKVALFAPAELGLGYLVLRQHEFAREASRRGDTTAYRFHRDWRTTWLFWTGAVTVFSMADAYISAKMFGFNRETQFARTKPTPAGHPADRRRLGLTLGPSRAGLVMEF